MPDPDPSSLLSVAAAVAVIDATPVRTRVVDVPLGEAEGLRLAADLLADRDYPPFDKSLMDGYAVRSADVPGPVALRVAGEVAAGRAATRAVGAGEAVAVMTGAAVPPGADAVVPVEDTAAEGGGFARVGQPVRVDKAAVAGRNVAPRGCDARRGEVVLPSGVVLRAPQVAVAASVGAAVVRVFDRPRVAVLGTGDELVGVGESPRAEQIRNSNTPMLAALLRRLGCAVRDLGVVRDDPAALRAALADGLRDDALFVTGGMSMGEYDYVPRLLAELGAELKVTKLRIKPGKPFVFATAPSGAAVFGLPGNPVSAFVCTVRLASRLLTRVAGGSPADGFRAAQLAAPLPANGPREFYQPAVKESGRVRPLPWKGSADIYTLAKADALIVRPENAPPAREGDEVMVMDLDGPVGV